ncbi:MAG TPA: hypothetical protein VJ969_02025 [Desulfopila sp.]|nr:hypothetical protein [Desulfopila sp.]
MFGRNQILKKRSTSRFGPVKWSASSVNKEDLAALYDVNELYDDDESA